MNEDLLKRNTGMLGNDFQYTWCTSGKLFVDARSLKRWKLQVGKIKELGGIYQGENKGNIGTCTDWGVGAGNVRRTPSC